MGILRGLNWPGIAALLCAAIFLACPPVYGQTAQSPELVEQKIKAGLVYNFLKYATWPDSRSLEGSGRLTVCLFGDDAFEGYLSPLEGRTAQKLVISISRVYKVSETESCNLLFIHHSQEDSLSEIFSFLKNKPVLTVSDIKKFASKGGMVELATENQHINLYINRMSVSRAGLVIQDRLMKLAKPVSG